jgi:hypothetical protein
VGESSCGRIQSVFLKFGWRICGNSRKSSLSITGSVAEIWTGHPRIQVRSLIAWAILVIQTPKIFWPERDNTNRRLTKSHNEKQCSYKSQSVTACSLPRYLSDKKTEGPRYDKGKICQFPNWRIPNGLADVNDWIAFGKYPDLNHILLWFSFSKLRLR